MDPLPGSPAAVATLLPGIRCAGTGSLPAGQDMGSDSHILEPPCSITHLRPSLQRANSQIADLVGHQSSDHVTGWSHPLPPFYPPTGSPGRAQECPAPLSMGPHSTGVPRVGLVELLKARNLQGTTETCLSSRD